jgi:SAM-dependent methyltransferase
MINYGICPLCDSDDCRLHLQTNDFFLSGEPFSLVRCRTCGFIFTCSPPDEKSIGNYYASEEYLSHNDSAKGLTSVLYRFARKLMLVKKRKLVERISGKKSGRLLDIGSGTGHFLREMKESGWTVNGIEINDKARKYSVSENNVEVEIPEQLSTYLSGSYDCVTMWHVLEHFHDPFQYASETKRLLKPGGICIIALPNCNSYDAEYYKKFWSAYDVPRHLWHFSPSTFSFFADRAGFTIKAIRSLPLDVFYISALSEKYKGIKFHFIAGMLKGIWFGFLSLFTKEKSSSLVYILEKR